MNKEMLLKELNELQTTINEIENYKNNGNNDYITEEEKKRRDVEVQSFLNAKEEVKNRLAIINEKLSDENNYNMNNSYDLSRNNIISDIATKVSARNNLQTEIESTKIVNNGFENEINVLQDENSRLDDSIAIYENKRDNETLSINEKNDINLSINKLKQIKSRNEGTIRNRKDSIKSNELLITGYNNVVTRLNEEISKRNIELKEKEQDQQIRESIISEQRKTDLLEKQNLEVALESMNLKEMIEYRDYKEVINSLINGIENDTLTDDEIKIGITDLKEIVKNGSLNVVTSAKAQCEAEIKVLEKKLNEGSRYVILDNQELQNVMEELDRLDYSTADLENQIAISEEKLALNNNSIYKKERYIVKNKSELSKLRMSYLRATTNEQVNKINLEAKDVLEKIKKYENDINNLKIENMELTAKNEKDNLIRNNKLESNKTYRLELVNKIDQLKKDRENSFTNDFQIAIDLKKADLKLISDHENILKNNPFERIDKIINGEVIKEEIQDNMESKPLGSTNDSIIDEGKDKFNDLGSNEKESDEDEYNDLGSNEEEFNDLGSNEKESDEDEFNDLGSNEEEFNDLGLESKTDDDEETKEDENKHKAFFKQLAVDKKNKIKEKIKTNIFKDKWKKFKKVLAASTLALSALVIAKSLDGCAVQEAVNNNIVVDNPDVTQDEIDNIVKETTKNTVKPATTPTVDNNKIDNKKEDSKQNTIKMTPAATSEPTKKSENVISNSNNNYKEENSTSSQTVKPTEKPSNISDHTSEPTKTPSQTTKPTVEPTEKPSNISDHTSEPTKTPSQTTKPTVEPTKEPTKKPGIVIEDGPKQSTEPTKTSEITIEDATDAPTVDPTKEPTKTPEITITDEPIVTPEATKEPTKTPTITITDEPIVTPEATKEPTKTPTITITDEPIAENDKGPDSSEKETTKIDVLNNEQLIIDGDNGDKYSVDNSNGLYSGITGDTKPMEENKDVVSVDNQKDKTTVTVEKNSDYDAVLGTTKPTENYSNVTVEDETKNMDDYENYKMSSSERERIIKEILGEDEEVKEETTGKVR